MLGPDRRSGRLHPAPLGDRALPARYLNAAYFHFFAGLVFCSSCNFARLFLASTSLGLIRRAALSCSIASEKRPICASAAARLICASAESGVIRSASL